MSMKRVGFVECDGYVLQRGARKVQIFDFVFPAAWRTIGSRYRWPIASGPRLRFDCCWFFSAGWLR
jgi:hypothetical protein